MPNIVEITDLSAPELDVFAIIERLTSGPKGLPLA